MEKAPNRRASWVHFRWAFDTAVLESKASEYVPLACEMIRSRSLLRVLQQPRRTIAMKMELPVLFVDVVE